MAAPRGELPHSELPVPPGLFLPAQRRAISGGSGSTSRTCSPEMFADLATFGLVQDAQEHDESSTTPPRHSVWSTKVGDVQWKNKEQQKAGALDMQTMTNMRLSQQLAAELAARYGESEQALIAEAILSIGTRTYFCEGEDAKVPSPPSQPPSWPTRLLNGSFAPKNPPPASKGSEGHPTNCGTPCKYVRRKGGCRDGADCPKCHLCQWRRGGLPKQATEQEAATTAVDVKKICSSAYGATEQQVSVGSVGHPYTCTAACKYIGKRAGCKDGERCTRCHLCRWNRWAEKGGSKEPGDSKDFAPTTSVDEAPIASTPVSPYVPGPVTTSAMVGKDSAPMYIDIRPF